MESSGIRRKVDDLGRIVIPSSIRRTLEIGEGAELEISLEGERVVLSRPALRCTFCGGGDHLETVHEKLVCWSCMAAIRALDRERTGEEVASRFRH